MYNDELKLRFIRETNKSIKRAEFFQFVFDRIEPQEIKYGKDFCCMSVEQIQETIDGLGVLKKSSFSIYATSLREYAKWCANQNVPGANLNIFEVNDPGSDTIKKRMVASPTHLQKFLDEIFNKESMETSDSVLRAYFWLAYCGIPEDLIFELRCRDVIGNGDYVYAKWHKHRVPKEGRASIKNCACLSSFLYFNSNYANQSGIRRDRIDGDLLLRGIRGYMKPSTASSRVKRIVKAANNNNKTTLSPTYQTIWLSGKFYYIYQRENAGIEPDFSEMSEEFLSDKDCTGVRDRGKRLQIASQRYEEEYNRWKSAFNL